MIRLRTLSATVSTALAVCLPFAAAHAHDVWLLP